MKVKNFLKAICLFLDGVGIVIAIKNLHRLWERKAVETETKRSREALNEFLDLNNLYEGFHIFYENDSGYTPIYLYNKKTFNPKKALIPKGYVLHKLKHTSGAVNYAYGPEPTGKSLFPNYPVLFYMVRKLDFF